MITIHQRNQNVSNSDDTFSKSAQNSLPWVLPDKYITDRLTIQLILSLPIFLLLIPPIHEYSTVRKMQCSAFTDDQQFINEQNFNVRFLLMSKFLCYIYPSSLPNLARLRTEKFLVLPTKSWNDTNTCSNFPKSQYSLNDKIRTTDQLITYTVPQNRLSLFTIHIQNCSIFVHFSSEAELQIFFLRVITWVRSDWAPM